MPHTKKQPSMLTWPIIRDGLLYLLRGKFYVRQAHLPPAGHRIPENFVGVCVASAADIAMDAYVIAQLRTLNINEVRLDFTYGDSENFNARFLNTLLAENFNVTLHLIQPFAHAKAMEGAAEQAQWQSFVEATLKRYSTQIKRIEVGTTINRKRWAGYTMHGFLNAWAIAYRIAKQQQVTIAGPNVTDFEPIYNIGILRQLQKQQQLPDVHTNNLFSERVSEPERFDHRVFKYRWATCFKVNLIKKARLLKKITTDFNIPSLISPVAFWAIYRIQRLLPDGEQKQADYAARYLLLNAASGALDQVYWGALICQREGLIDDGLTEADYPTLERVTHYQHVDGHLQNFRYHASFNAFKTAAALIQGAQYQGAIATAQGLEIHHFQTATHAVHAAWTINGKVALLNEIYTQETLAQAEITHRDGHALNANAHIVSESPIYLRWPINHAILLQPQPKLSQSLAIHAHIPLKQYYPLQQDGWFGMVLATSAEEARLITQQLHPSTLLRPEKDAALRHARNAIWALPDPRDAAKQITVKQPVKMYPHKALLDRFKPSKAKRSWNGAVELLRRGVDTAMPIAFFEKINDTSLKQNFYLCDYVTADSAISEMFMHFAKGNSHFHFADKNITISANNTYSQLADFLSLLHLSGSFFRDLSGGNVLVQAHTDHTLHFSLIDTARARFYNHHTPLKERYADLARICNKLHWAGRERLVGLYLANINKKFTWDIRLHFYLYDFKVNFKRKFGRKGIKRLVKKFKNQPQNSS